MQSGTPMPPEQAPFGAGTNNYNDGDPMVKRCLPYGASMSFAAGGTLVGLILFYAASFGCKTFTVEIEQLSNEMNFTNLTATGGTPFVGAIRTDFRIPGQQYELAVDADGKFDAGYWYIEVRDQYDNKECLAFEDVTYVDFDAVFKLGRAVTVMGGFIGPMFTAFFITLACIQYVPSVIYSVALSSYVMAAFSALVLVGLGSDVFDKPGLDVTPGPGSYVAIAAFLFWIIAPSTVFCCLRERPVTAEEDGASPPRGMNKTVVETIHNPDGTSTQITTTYVNNRVVQRTTATVAATNPNPATTTAGAASPTAAAAGTPATAQGEIPPGNIEM